MTRQGTVIRHTLLDSDTYAAMPDNVRSVFLCLILASDDWGRLPDNPLKLNRMISVCCKLPEEITSCIDWMLLDGCLTRYRVGESTFLQWVKWEEHQSRLKSRDRPRYPAPDGELESSTNPLAVAKQSPDGTPDDAPDGIPDGGLKERKGKERKLGKGKEKKEECALTFDQELHDLVDEIFPPSDYEGWTEPQRLKQVDALDKLTRLDKFPQDEVFAVLRWMRQDDFWNGVFNSIPRLRDDGQKKYRNAQGQWKTKSRPSFNKRLTDDSKFTETKVIDL